MAEVARVLERDRQRAADAAVRAGRVSARSSPTSRTFAANAAARSSPRSQPSSFRCEPQPEELTTTSSTSSNAVDQLARERLSLLEPAGVDRERAAAALGRRHDLEAVGGEHAGSRGVHVGEDRALHAAGEQADARPPSCPDAGVTRRHLAAAPPLRRELDERPEPPRQRRVSPERREREARRASGRGRGARGRGARAAGARPADARAPARRLRGSPRSAGRSARRTGTS